MPSSVFYSALMLMAGFGIPLMASLNSGLAAQLGSPALASTVLFAIGFAVSAAYLLICEGMPTDASTAGTSWHLYLGGVLVSFYILSVTWVAPKFGVGNAISFILLGQLISICLIDHFGWFGARVSTLDASRLIGIALMTAGVFLVIKRSS